jgi:hypothetical protein
MVEKNIIRKRRGRNGKSRGIIKGKRRLLNDA